VREYIERVRREYEALLRYEGSMHCLSFEGLKKDPRPILRKAAEYLGVEASEAVIENMIVGGDFKKLKALDRYFAEHSMPALRQKFYIMFRIFGRRTAHDMAYKAVNHVYYRKARVFLRDQENAAHDIVSVPGKLSHYRKGRIGDWKDYISKEQARLMEERIGPLEKRVFEKYAI
jgi:hypothetical protein